MQISWSLDIRSLHALGLLDALESSGGRDHWPDCFSVLLAGGGAAGGTLYGSSDKLGAYPDQNPVTPGDHFRPLRH